MISGRDEILFLIARDFAQLTSIEQKNVGIKLGVVTIGIIGNQDHEIVAQTIFSEAFRRKKMPELVKAMKPYLYE